MQGTKFSILSLYSVATRWKEKLDFHHCCGCFIFDSLAVAKNPKSDRVKLPCTQNAIFKRHTQHRLVSMYAFRFISNLQIILRSCGGLTACLALVLRAEPGEPNMKNWLYVDKIRTIYIQTWEGHGNSITMMIFCCNHHQERTDCSYVIPKQRRKTYHCTFGWFGIFYPMPRSLVHQ